MNITVILCTYNRSQILAQALESVVGSKLPESTAWEVLVVDNNSSDTTRAVVEDFCRRYPGRFRYLFEAHPGKSYALNAGVRAARGEVLAFTDDDVTVEASWLQNLTAVLDGEEWAGAGGRTRPARAFSPPRWMALEGPYSLGGVLAALFDLGDKPCQLDRAPYGANMAFRKKMFENYGGFRLDLGPSPTRDIPRPNEDAEFGRRLMAAGERLRYEPAAVVYHPIPEARIEKEYFLNWWFDYGRALVREAGKRAEIFGIPRHYLSIPKMIVALLAPRTLRWMVALDPPKRLFNKCWVWMTAGEIVETYHRARASRQKGVLQETKKKCDART